MIQNIELDKIRDNPFNPRSYYNRDKIADLASSIKQVGLIEVPQARGVPGGFYEIAYGGYRLRAYQSLAKKDKTFNEMPLDVKPLTDEQMALMGLEENLKRDDMTPMETARAVDTYLTKFEKCTEKELAEKLTMNQGSISNMRRVLRLPAKVLEKVNEGKINFTMARELCLLQGIKPTRSRYGGALSEEQRTDEYMMMEAIRGVTGQYGNCTVNGIKKSIYDVVSGGFPCLNKREGYHSEETLFDWRSSGCLKCEKVVKANETQSQVNSFCTDRECWDKKQKAHKDAAAKEAQAKMTADLAKRVLADQKKIKAGAAAPQNISQEISGEEKEYRFFPKGEKGVKDTKAKSPREALEKMGVKQEDGELRVETKTAGHYKGWAKVEDTPVVEAIHAIHTNAAEALLTKDERKFLEAAQAADIAGDSSQEAIRTRQRRQQLAGRPDWPCLSCANIGKCDGTMVQEVLDETTHVYGPKCEQKVTSAPEKVTSKAVLEIPSGLLDKVKYTAGSRAQILDLFQLRVGSYGSELTHGHQLLDGLMDQMDNPQECIEQCTKGFHYAFDSQHPTSGTRFVCTDPKCLSQKKAAFTRAKNARGMLKKKCEAEAIKTVVKATDRILDIPRIELIFLANLMGSHVSNMYSTNNANKAQDWLTKRLKVDTDKLKNQYGEAKKEAVALLILQAIDKLPVEDMNQLLVEFMFEQLRYDGELGNYQVRTTKALALFHVGVQIPKEAADPEKVKHTDDAGAGAGDEGGGEEEEDE